MTIAQQTGWIPVCPLGCLQPERGVAAILPDHVQVAVFRTGDDTLYAVSNLDPFCGVSVLSRGIVGDRAGVPTVASPMHKQVFALASGICLDDPQVRVPVFMVRQRDGMVEIADPGAGVS